MYTGSDLNASVGLTVGSAVPIKFMVRSEDDRATLVIGAHHECEISFGESALATLRDLTDDALRRLATDSGEVE